MLYRDFFYLDYKLHIFHFSSVLRTCGNDIDTGGVDACMPQYIGKLGDILFDPVKCTGKQVTEIVRKHLARCYVCLTAKRLHFSPDVASAHRLSSPCDKYRPLSDTLLLNVMKQFFL